jgi:hypothetical protein
MVNKIVRCSQIRNITPSVQDGLPVDSTASPVPSPTLTRMAAWTNPATCRLALTGTKSTEMPIKEFESKQFQNAESKFREPGLRKYYGAK